MQFILWSVLAKEICPPERLTAPCRAYAVRPISVAIWDVHILLNRMSYVCWKLIFLWANAEQHIDVSISTWFIVDFLDCSKRISTGSTINDLGTGPGKSRKNIFLCLFSGEKMLMALLQERKFFDCPSPGKKKIWQPFSGKIVFHRGSQEKNFLFEFLSGSPKIINGQPITAINSLNNQSLLILTSWHGKYVYYKANLRMYPANKKY